VILAAFWMPMQQNPLSMGGQQTFFVLILDRSDICLPSILVLVQKLSSEGKSGTCAPLEILQSSVDFFRRAKLLALLHKFCILPAYFCKY
jgi:hypothetical protein